MGAGEEDLIFEYLNLLASRPDVARALGERAARYVKEECNWDRVAGLYASFLQSVVEGTRVEAEVTSPQARAPKPEAAAQLPARQHPSPRTTSPVGPPTAKLWAMWTRT